MLEQESVSNLDEIRLKVVELIGSVGGKDLLDSVSFILWDCNREARVVEDILKGEEIAIDDKGGNATSVDSLESSSSPVIDIAVSENTHRTAIGEERMTHQAGIPRGNKQNLAELRVPR